MNMRTEPVRIIGIIIAVLLVAQSFLTGDASLGTAIEALIQVIVVGVGTETARSEVSPRNKVYHLRNNAYDEGYSDGEADNQ